MAKPLLDDALWSEIEAFFLLPKQRRKRFPNRKPVEHRMALTGILFVLQTGLPWKYLLNTTVCIIVAINSTAP